MIRDKRGCNEVSERRSRALIITRFLCLVLMRDKDEKLFSHRQVVEKISSNLIALTLSSGYSFSSDIQNCNSDKSLYLDINVVSQESIFFLNSVKIA